MIQQHSIPPLYSAASRALVLGSFPSVKSREGRFFYHHPQNRFWRVMAAVLGCPVPNSTEEKRMLLLSHDIAVWDVIASCEIQGSSDASIRAVVPNDLGPILDNAPIERIFCNGMTAWKLYQKYQLPLTGRQAVRLPSTSPANAAWQLPALVEAWSAIRKE